MTALSSQNLTFPLRRRVPRGITSWHSVLAFSNVVGPRRTSVVPQKKYALHIGGIASIMVSVLHT